MTARVQIQIEAQDASSGVLRAITSQFGALGSAVSDMSDMFSKNNAALDLYERGLTDSSVSIADVTRAEEMAAASTARFAESITMLAMNALKEAINSTVEYAAEVEKVSLMSGASAAQSSRLIQVLDDYKISTEDITTAMRKMTTQGYAPTIENIATLSDQYNALNTTQEKNAFLIENLGRGGAEWAKVLALGSDALMEMNGSVNQNLILTEAQIQATEEYRLNVDQLQDSWQGVTILLGNSVIPALNNVFTVINKVAEAQTGLENQGISPYEAHRLALMGFKSSMEEVIPLTRTYAEGYQMLQAAYENSVPVMDEVIVNYDELIGSITDYQDELDRYIDKNASIRDTENELLAQRNDYIVQLGELRQKYGDGSKAVQDMEGKISDINGKLDDNKKKLAENEEAHKKWAAQTVFAFAQARAAADGSISKIEGDLLIKAGTALGLFDQQTAEVMGNVNDAFNNLDASNAEQVIGTLTEQIEALTGQSYQVVINTMYTTTGTPPNVPLQVVDSTSASQCFVGGTKITMWDYSLVNIENVKVGDVVLSYDEKNKEFVTRKVEQIFKHEAHEYLIINGLLGVTPNHKLYVNGEWKNAGEIVTGDVLFLDDETFEVVETIEEVKENAFVFNLHTEDDPHNYFADGYLVHNKQMGGEVYAGKAVMVGEGGSEPFMPSQNGRILGHAESLHALSMGGGGANYFYGNVTLQVGSDDASGLLEYR